MSDDSATADRVEKKSIDEAIASFAMLVRSEYMCLLYAYLYEWEEGRRRMRGNRFFSSSSFNFFGDVLCLTFGKSSALRVNSLEVF